MFFALLLKEIQPLHFNMLILRLTPLKCLPRTPHLLTIEILSNTGLRSISAVDLAASISSGVVSCPRFQYGLVPSSLWSNNNQGLELEKKRKNTLSFSKSNQEKSVQHWNLNKSSEFFQSFHVANHSQENLFFFFFFSAKVRV